MPDQPAVTSAQLPDRPHQTKRILVTALCAGGVCSVLYTIPGSPEGRMMVTVMAAVVIFWISESVPLWIPAIVGPTILFFANVVPSANWTDRFTNTYGQFTNPIVFLFLGSFLIAQAMEAQGVGQRLADAILTRAWLRRSSQRIIFALGAITGVLSMWTSNTATTALMLPLALAMTKKISDAHTTRMTLLMLPFAATIGGLATPIGTPPNLIALPYLAKLGLTISFLNWMMLALPFCVVMLAVLAILLLRRVPNVSLNVRLVTNTNEEPTTPWHRPQLITLAVFLLAIVLWISSGFLPIKISESAIAIGAAGMLFVVPTGNGFGVLKPRALLKVDWGTLVLIGGGLVLGDLMLKTGLAHALALGWWHVSGASSTFWLTALSAGLAIGLSELTSNTATAAMLLPIIVEITQTTHIPPTAPLLAATFGCSFGFMLPVSTPPNAIVYGTGLLPLRTMMRYGFVLDVLGWLLLVLAFGVLYPALGWV